MVDERRTQARLGGRKLYHLLKPELGRAGVRAGRDRFFEELRQLNLLLKPVRAEYPTTTQSGHQQAVYPNRIKDLQVTGPNQVWVSDITYVRTDEGFVFLSLVTDRWSRKIVGYHCGERLDSQGCLQALELALAMLPPEAHPIHHSDRGTQYCSQLYVGRLEQRQLGISMTERNHCAENALAERMNGILKQEYGLGQRFPTKADAVRAAAQGVWLYNHRRPHTELAYRMPAEVHESGR